MNIKQLVEFGNFLFKTYKVKKKSVVTKKQEPAEVSHADIENWKESNKRNKL